VDEDGGRMSDQQLRDELLTLVLAGHETTANALSFAFYLLSKNPGVARRIAAEADAVLGDEAPTLATIGRLELTGRVVDEALRLYPPAWIFERQAIAEDTLGGYRIPPGTIIGVAPWTLHRSPKLWDNPEGFDPDRFLPDAVAARPKHVYLPFGGGPRVCIGNNFALVETKLVTAMICRRHRLDLVPGTRLELEPGITLRPKGGIPMTLHARASDRERVDRAA
jgi:cytochrome P450